jgi:predicted Zn-dependent protease
MHAVLADSYQRMGRRLDAVAEWRKALELDTANRMLQARLAESLIRARIYPEAEQILTPLVASHPENGEWQYLLGNALLQQKRDQEALPHLIAATERLPNLLPAQEALGRAYLDSGKPTEAVSHLEKARPLDDGSISFALSSAYQQLGRDQEARAALARYREINKSRSDSALIDDKLIPPPPAHK